MNFLTMKEAAQFRVTESDDNYWVEDYWKAAIKVFTRDVDQAIAFFRDECTDEELYWLSEIFEEIIDKTQSRELLETLRNRLAVVTLDRFKQDSFKTEYIQKNVNYKTYVADVSSEIDYAEGKIKQVEV